MDQDTGSTIDADTLIWIKVLQEMFGIPQGPGHNGSSRGNPLTVHIPWKELANTIAWMFQEWDKAELRATPSVLEEKYTMLLATSRFLMMDRAAHEAITELGGLKLPATRRLQLAQQFTVDEWIRPSIQSLVLWRSLGSLSSTEIDQLGIGLFVIIAGAKEALQKYRAGIAYQPMDLTEAGEANADLPTCSTHDQCKAAWPAWWWRNVARKIIYPDNPIDLEDVVEIVKAGTIKGMSNGCKEAVMEKLAQVEWNKPVINQAVLKATTFIHSC
ncbi:hypothetical protein PC9H_008900 [Pleurotus ostreatus]|uniref:Uncharacterized protein n=2 Tax=Pleurotus TaxID=5320 RepID=A0A8H6ZTI3_PLEOS|nr:uncharacterized protein PC9H_008900 [Pleurotus ostreatus]KAF7426531.1 hypothetical protein PC9H_008900 [Pleurotus ostreatus]KAG9221935.1 hypothetical protein CCMSSC00406_0010261 [Pleurotus cornucopiae]KAJ8694093.1 hypothetical protein PTI98_009026 [Pleurotus ostreatus]